MLFCGIINSSAQEKDTLTLRNEVSFGIGASSAFGTLVRAVSLGDHSIGFVVHGQYLYNINKRIGLGVLGVFEYFGASDGRHKHGALFSINPTARFYWFNHKHFAMYSKVGVGVLLGLENKVDAIPMINVSLVGMEFGGGKWRGFTELLPIGTMGILNIGLKHSF